MEENLSELFDWRDYVFAGLTEATNPTMHKTLDQLSRIPQAQALMQQAFEANGSRVSVSGAGFGLYANAQEAFVAEDGAWHIYSLQHRMLDMLGAEAGLQGAELRSLTDGIMARYYDASPRRDDVREEVGLGRVVEGGRLVHYVGEPDAATFLTTVQSEQVYSHIRANADELAPTVQAMEHAMDACRAVLNGDAYDIADARRMLRDDRSPSFEDGVYNRRTEPNERLGRDVNDLPERFALLSDWQEMDAGEEVQPDAACAANVQQRLGRE